MGKKLSLIEKLNKNLKGAHVSIMSESDISKHNEWSFTPAMDLNRIISGSLFKGLPSRNVVGIAGPEHSMKSSFMILSMVEAQKQGFKPILIDTELGSMNDFCLRWGLDIDKTIYIYTISVEEIITTLGQLLSEEDEKYIIGIDSIGGLIRQKAIEEAKNDGNVKADQGLLQKDIRLMMKLFGNVCALKNSIGICTLHMYSQPGSIPVPDKIGGGKAVRLFSNILISLEKEIIYENPEAKSKKEKGNVIGNRIKATTLKNRIYPPFQTATVEIDYRRGINKYAGLMDLLINSGIVDVSGSWYTFNDGTKVQGERKAYDYFSKNPNEYLKELDKWLESTGYSTVNENVKESEDLMNESSDEIEPDEIKTNEIETKINGNGKKSMGKK